MKGFSGTLTNKIVRRHLTTGLHYAAGNFTIIEEILANLDQKIRKEQEKTYQSR
jgi:hypothetical protein